MEKEKYLIPILVVLQIEATSNILEGSNNLENPGNGGEWTWD